MMDNDAFKTLDLDKDLVALKKGESNLIRELQRVVDLFNRGLLVKEKVRVSLMEKIVQSEKTRNEVFEKLKKVVRNIEIYDKNLEHIEERKAEGQRREIWLKAKYEEILHHSSSSQILALANEETQIFGEICQELLSLNEEVGKINRGANREDFTKCREEYLRCLQKLFQKLDEQLSDMEKEREKLKKYSAEIKRKKEKAVKQQTALKKNYNLLLEDIKGKKVDLEVSVHEEKTLIAEYRRVLDRFHVDAGLSREMEELLEKILTSREAENESGEEGDIVESSSIVGSKDNGPR